jgi:hypothetical protein
MEDKAIKIEQVKELIKKLENKDFNIYFFTLDTKGNPTAGIANIYEHVKVLNELGYKAAILHEKDDYKLRGDENGMGIAEWLGEEYANLPHHSIQKQNLNISPNDFIIIPEIFSTIMEQVKGFPCRKIVFCQSYDYLLELLPIGRRWDFDYGFSHVITTSEKQSEHIRTLFHQSNVYITPVSIPTYFKPNDKPKVPIVTVLTRNPGDAAKIAKMFYLQFPTYKWITFKELRGIPRKDFAAELAKSCLAVWIDDPAGFGTFPLEAMECGTPVIGKMPNMIPEWMETKDENGNAVIANNGVWTNTTLNIPELIATFLKLWFEDNLPTDLLEKMKESTGQYTPERQKQAIEDVFNQLVQERIAEFNKIIETEGVNV